jgi:hypothetical protein
MNIIGSQYLERWTDEESHIILNTAIFNYSQRLTALTFLFGNIGDVDLVYAALHQQIGVDARDHDHAQRFLADLASGRYDLKYHYFDVLFLDGSLNAHRTHHLACSPACCASGSANARALVGRTGAGRRWPSSAHLCCSTPAHATAYIVLRYQYAPVQYYV